MSWDWSCCLIQSLALWYLTTCCKTISLIVSMAGAWANFDFPRRSHMCCDSAWNPSSGNCCKSDISSSRWVQKWSSDFIVVPIASNAALGLSIYPAFMTPLSIRLWRAFLSSPSNISFSCFQPLWD